MEINTTYRELIEGAYEKYYRMLVQYFKKRITILYHAEDLAQDVFVRLLCYEQLLREDTLQYLLFRVARNILTDYLRHIQVARKWDSFNQQERITNEVEEKLYVKDVIRIELSILKTFPKERQQVYFLHRYEERNADEISLMLNVSKKSIDNHLYTGRKIMRRQLKKIV